MQVNKRHEMLKIEKHQRHQGFDSIFSKILSFAGMTSFIFLLKIHFKAVEIQ